MKSVMTHSFSNVPESSQIQRSSFNRSHGYKTTFDGGFLCPIYLDEILPGDAFNLQMNAFARMATLIRPLMDNVFLDVHFFFVATRLVFENWEKLNGQQNSPGDSTDYLVPVTTAPADNGYDTMSLQDFFGLPIGVPSVQHSSLPLRAYNLIWNEWYRDENLQTPVTVPMGNGPDLESLFVLKRRGKRHDYFTSALPWPQKGSAITIPLASRAPVSGLGKFNTAIGLTNVSVYDSAAGGATVYPHTTKIDPAASGQSFYVRQTALTGIPDVYADLTAAGASVAAVRNAFMVQGMLELDARGGTRYTEIIRAHFGVTSPDARLQRPEYLGGGGVMININPIAQTSSTDATTPQANLSGMGTGHVRGVGFTKAFTEHGYVIGLVSARADLTYQQGLQRMWSKRTRYDFFWPGLAHLGEQAILNKEIFMANTANDEAVFGYQERYAEYRYKPSLVTGLFKSTSGTNLDSWHLAQYYTTQPVLNSSFIEENPPIDRVIAVPTEPHFLLDCFFDLKSARPMPVYSVPSLMGRL